MIRTVIKVDGMMCGMCETHINEAVRKHLPVKKVKANRRKKEVLIESEAELDRDLLKKTIDETGYTFLGFAE